MRIVIGLGGNLGNPVAAFHRALDRLGHHARTATVSGLYRSRAVGPPQPDYLNAAALIDWPGPPRLLLARCLELETDAGRTRSPGERWGPRTLDLDLLLADGLVCRGTRLVLPHPLLLMRPFALVPAAEIAPAWRHPTDGRTLAACIGEGGARPRDDLVLRRIALSGKW